jgi:hypothetical protein
LEGLNILGILLGYLAVFVFGLACLVAVGLLIAHQTKAARIVFAAGWLCAAVIAAIAALSFLSPVYQDQESTPMIVLLALSLLFAGAGQFVAALRGPGTYAAAFGCAAASMGIVVGSALFGADLIGVLGQELVWPGWLQAGVSLFLGVASLGIAVLLPFGTRQTGPERPHAPYLR